LNETLSILTLEISLAQNPSQILLGIGTSMVGMPFKGGSLTIDIADINGQQAPLLADPNRRDPVAGLKGSLSKSADSDTPLTEKSSLPPMRPLSFWQLLTKVDYHPSNIGSIL
jgi:hypothetical protein